MNALEHASPWRSFVVIDTETNGLDEGDTAVPDPRVIELGAVRFDDGVETGRFCSLVRTGVPIPAEATAIHGITDERCADAPPIAQAWKGVLELVAAPTDIVIAYNGAFDARFLSRDIKRARAEGFDIAKPPRVLMPPWGDVLVWIRHEKLDKWVPGKGRHKLSATCQRWGVSLEQAHSAEADARACGQLWLAMERKVRSCVDAGDVASLLRVQSMLYEQQQRELNEYFARQRAQAARAERKAGAA